VIAPGRIEAFLEAAESPDEADLPRAALTLPLLEYRNFDPTPSLGRLMRLGTLATARIERLGAMASAHARIDALNTLLFEDEGFQGNAARYEDPRNSFLNDVLDRKTGIPISLAIIYLEVGRQAGLLLEGVNFPGHFLVRCRPGSRDPEGPRELIIDPFHQGALLSEADCRQMLRRYLGDDAVFDRRLMATADKRDILVRMLQNLKRLYVSMRSFPQARDAVDLLLALHPFDYGELRDRGLLSYHQQDYQAALRDLEAYFRSAPKVSPDADSEQREEHNEVWEHLKSLRRRVAGLN
jgi:regulator of sirC expression with transglutaminase-like and TPR domain